MYTADDSPSVILLEEPNAATVAYMLLTGKAMPDRANYMVYDIGGNTLDITMGYRSGHCIQVLRMGGSTDAGGTYLTQHLVKAVKQVWDDRVFSL